jgi:hypothetical protein
VSLAEFENLVERYLDKTISRAEEARLLELIQESPEFKKRFKVKVRLHEAVNRCLSENNSTKTYFSFAWLNVYVNRMSKVASYTCLIAMAFVQLRVTLPVEYTGMMYSLSEAINDDKSDFRDNFYSEEILANSEIDDMSDWGMPDLENTDMLSPTDEEVGGLTILLA